MGSKLTEDSNLILLTQFARNTDTEILGNALQTLSITKATKNSHNHPLAEILESVQIVDVDDDEVVSETAKVKEKGQSSTVFRNNAYPPGWNLGNSTDVLL